MKTKRTKKHNPRFSFDAGDTRMRFELLPGGVVECSMNESTTSGCYDALLFEDNALDVVANLRQAAAEIERMYFEQGGNNG